MDDLLIRYLHFIGIILLASTLAAENVLLSKNLKIATVKKLALIDGFYGVSAITVLAAGLLLWFVVGKPSEFYSSNTFFHVKLGLFAFIALLSVFPTIFFLNARQSVAAEVLVPSYVIYIKRIEAVTLLLLPLFAVLMARGYGNA